MLNVKDFQVAGTRIAVYAGCSLPRRGTSHAFVPRTERATALMSWPASDGLPRPHPGRFAERVSDIGLWWTEGKSTM